MQFPEQENVQSNPDYQKDVDKKNAGEIVEVDVRWEAESWRVGNHHVSVAYHRPHHSRDWKNQCYSNSKVILMNIALY